MRSLPRGQLDPLIAEATTPSALRAAFLNNQITPYTNKVYNALAAQGHDVFVASCTRAESNRNWADTMSPSYHHTVLPGVTVRLAPNRYAHANLGVGKYLTEVKPDVVVINGFYPTMIFGALWAKVAAKPLVITTDGGANDMPRTLYHRIARPLVLSNCRSVITCSNNGRAFFESQGVDPAAIFKSPLVPGWDPPSRITGFGERPFHLLWVAQMNDEIKNAGFLVEIAAALKRRHGPVKLRLVGRGPAQDRILAELTSAGVDFVHTESVHWANMESIYSAARVLLLPSRQEPWGLVCNEAMQCGTPCIVSPVVGAAGDLVLNDVNGRVCDLDADTWADAAYSLSHDEALWGQFSEQGRRAADERTSERSARIVADALASAVARP